MQGDDQQVASPGDAEVLTFGGGNLKFLIFFYETVIVIAIVGVPLLAFRFLVSGGTFQDLIHAIMFGAIFLGPVLFFLFPTARTYRKARGQRLQVDNTGLTLLDAGLHLPWAALESVLTRSHKRWRYIEIERARSRDDLGETFRAFNENVPCTVGLMKASWVGFTSSSFQHPTEDEQRFLAAVERHAPALLSRSP